MKKGCAGCGKQIPQAAQHCVFCGAKQALLEGQAPESEAAASISEALARAAESADAVAAAGDGSPARSVEAAVPAHPSKAGVTLVGLSVSEVQAAMRAELAAQAAAQSDEPLVQRPPDPTPVRGLPVVAEEPAAPPARREPASPIASDQVGATPFAALLRLVMASGGLVLIALFSLPWHGATSWQLLETLAGADFVRQLYFLAGGVVLLATAVLPVPLVFRALVGATVAALPLVLGAEGLLDGWRGLVAALAIVALPATHLVRTRRGGGLDGFARGLVVVAAGFVALLYLVPVSSVMPIVYVARLLGSMSVGHTVVGLFIAIPLVLAALSLLGALGRDLTSVAVLLSVLILLWAPAAVLIFVDDGTQLYVALALLWTSATAALSLAQLLSLAADEAPHRA